MSEKLQEATMHLMCNKLEEAETKKARLARLGIDTSKLNTKHKKLLSMVMNVNPPDELIQLLSERPSDSAIPKLAFELEYGYLLYKDRPDESHLSDDDVINILKTSDNNKICIKLLQIVGHYSKGIPLTSVTQILKTYYEKYPETEGTISLTLLKRIQDLLLMDLTPEQVGDVLCKVEKGERYDTGYVDKSKSDYIVDLFELYNLSYKDYVDINNACPDHYFILDELLSVGIRDKEQLKKYISTISKYLPDVYSRSHYRTKTRYAMDYVLDGVPDILLKGLLLNDKITEYDLPYSRSITKLLKNGEKPEDILASILSDKYSSEIFNDGVRTGQSLAEINQEYEDHEAKKADREAKAAAEEEERLANLTPEERLSEKIFDLREELIEDLNSFNSRLYWDANEIYDNCAITEKNSADYQYIEIFVHLDDIDSKPYYTVNKDKTRYTSAKDAYKNRYWTTNN